MFILKTGQDPIKKESPPPITIPHLNPGSPEDLELISKKPEFKVCSAFQANKNPSTPKNGEKEPIYFSSQYKTPLFSCIEEQNHGLARQGDKKQLEEFGKSRLEHRLAPSYSIGRWEKDEHEKFVQAIITPGNSWQQIQELVITRSNTQIRSHAQKFFEKLQRKREIIDLGENFTRNSLVKLQEKMSELEANEYSYVVQKLNKIACEKSKDEESDDDEPFYKSVPKFKTISVEENDEMERRVKLLKKKRIRRRKFNGKKRGRKSKNGSQDKADENTQPNQENNSNEDENKNININIINDNQNKTNNNKVEQNHTNNNNLLNNKENNEAKNSNENKNEQTNHANSEANPNQGSHYNKKVESHYNKRESHYNKRDNTSKKNPTSHHKKKQPDAYGRFSSRFSQNLRFYYPEYYYQSANGTLSNMFTSNKTFKPVISTLSTGNAAANNKAFPNSNAPSAFNNQQQANDRKNSAFTAMNENPSQVSFPSSNLYYNNNNSYQRGNSLFMGTCRLPYAFFQLDPKKTTPPKNSNSSNNVDSNGKTNAGSTGTTATKFNYGDNQKYFESFDETFSKITKEKNEN